MHQIVSKLTHSIRSHENTAQKRYSRNRCRLHLLNNNLNIFIFAVRMMNPVVYIYTPANTLTYTNPIPLVTDASMCHTPSIQFENEMLFAFPRSVALTFTSDSRCAFSGLTFCHVVWLIHVTSHLVNATNGFHVFCEIRFFAV